ncbi:putative F-box protein [Cardamine amara subsp. amara]|uniref:F-box protein n=1 Tax=Cardamine amara subsp. amara TaxID=228776 RepID=A0ABD1BSQ0_CARAN
MLSTPNYFFGYDPVKGEYKVLAIDNIPARSEHKVVVLGGEEEAWTSASWRACPHFAYTMGLCMNGNLYYGASRMDIDPPNNSIIVSFNLTLETFNIIKVPTNVLPLAYDNMWAAKPYRLTDKILINYRGKIGVVETPREGSFRVWVVEDAKKEVWSMNTYHLPQSAAGLDFKVMETFYNGEICLVSKRLYGPFCLFYYNLKTKCMRSDIIEGRQISELKRVDRGISVTVSDHYENFMFLDT